MPDLPAPYAASDPPRSAALLRAIAVHPPLVPDMVVALGGRANDDTTLLSLMAQASRAAVQHLPGVQWAGVTAQFDRTPFTTTHTDARVLIVDEGQYATRDGPCLQAIRRDAVVSMNITEVASTWPDL